MKIDLNCDMGESFGVYHLGQDAAVMPEITSVNIACGFHAGDPLVMDETVQLAQRYGVAVGAHPGYPDLQGFGRRNMKLTADEVERIVLYQVGALAGFARSLQIDLVHVKPHGALYNQAAADRSLAEAVARGVARFSRHLILVGLAGSALIEAGIAAGLRVANEGFPDRAYQPDGSLRPRGQPGAVLASMDEIAAHAVKLAREGIQIDFAGEAKTIRVDTLCLHGDHPHAAENARSVRVALKAAGMNVMSLGEML